MEHSMYIRSWWMKPLRSNIMRVFNSGANCNCMHRQNGKIHCTFHNKGRWYKTCSSLYLYRYLWIKHMSRCILISMVQANFCKQTWVVFHLSILITLITCNSNIYTKTRIKILTPKTLFHRQIFDKMSKRQFRQKCCQKNSTFEKSFSRQINNFILGSISPTNIVRIFQRSWM